MAKLSKQCLGVFGLILLAACNRSVYVTDGVTDGDTFYLPTSLGAGSDPVKQSWVTYSLGRSTCKLQMGGENPARNSNFDCEFTARKLLLKSWQQELEESSQLADPYLDSLTQVSDAGFLQEYVWDYFRDRDWDEPNELRLRDFQQWKKEHLSQHTAQTRLIGSWGFAAK